MRNDSIAAMLVLLTFALFTLGCASSNMNANKNTATANVNAGTLSEADYKAACEEVPVSELTNNPDAHAGQNVRVAGEVVVYEETSDPKAGTTETKLVIGVNDPSYVLQSGKLPVYISYAGTTSAFINDQVIVYGEFYGNDTPGLQSIQKKTLPRINAKYVDIV